MSLEKLKSIDSSEVYLTSKQMADIMDMSEGNFRAAVRTSRFPQPDKKIGNSSLWERKNVEANFDSMYAVFNRTMQHGKQLKKGELKQLRALAEQAKG